MTLGEPARLLLPRLRTRQPQNKALFETEFLQVGAGERILPFTGRSAAPCDESAEPGVAAPVDDERDETQSTFEAELRSDEELQGLDLLPTVVCFLSRGDLFDSHVGPHYPCDGALVGDSECLVAKRPRLRDELLRMRSASQERKIRDAVQLCIAERLAHGSAGLGHGVAVHEGRWPCSNRGRCRHRPTNRSRYAPARRGVAKARGAVADHRARREGAAPVAATSGVDMQPTGH